MCRSRACARMCISSFFDLRMCVRACGYDRKEFLSLATFNDYAALVQASVNQNNTWSAQQAQKQMDFQRQMSNTAHQREIADLKAAGLNPVLSAQTNGASTPSGASANGDTSGTSALVELLKEFGEGIAGASASGSAYGYSRGKDSSDNSVSSVLDVADALVDFLPYKYRTGANSIVKLLKKNDDSVSGFVDKVKQSFTNISAKPLAAKFGLTGEVKAARESGRPGRVKVGSRTPK